MSSTPPEQPSLQEVLDSAGERRMEATRVRHHGEDARRESGEWLRLALSGARAGVWEWNLLTNEVIWSPELYDLLGLPRGEAEPSFETFFGFIHPADRERLQAGFEEAAARGGPFHLEFRAIRADGTEMWISSVGRVEHGAGGAPVRAMGINQDITARKQAELDAAFWAELGERIRLSADPEELMWTVAQATAHHLRVTRCHFAELDEAAGLWLIHRDAHDESVPSNAGQHPATAFSPAMLEEARAGQNLVCADTQADPRTAGQYEASYGALGTRAFVAIPLLREGRLAALLAVNSQTPRVWTAAEVTLLETVAERTWNAVEKLRQERLVRASEERYRTLFNSIDEGFCVVEMLFDASGRPVDYRFLETNPVFEQQTGLAHAVGRTAHELVPGLEEHWAAIYGQVAVTGEPVRFVNGSEAMGRWFDTYTFRVGGPESRKVAILFTDITERRQAEADTLFLAELAERIRTGEDAEKLMADVVQRTGEHLQLARCYFAEIFEAEGCWRVHGDYHPSLPSIAGEYLVSVFNAEVLREMREGHVLVAEDTKTDPRSAANYETGYEPIGVRAHVIVPFLREGRWISNLVAASIEPRRWQAREITLLEAVAERTWNAIEKLRLNASLRRSEALLREADRRKDEFLAMLAHELRNPLAPIRNAAQVLRLVGPADAHQRWAREVIERQTQHLTRLVDDLLDVSRITQGKVKLAREPLDLSTIVNRAVEASRPLIDARRHELTVALPPEPVRLEGDLTRLVQVVGNLLNNAAKYTDEGGQIRIEAAGEGAEAVIRVRDNGMGLPADLLPHVFDLFTQADRSLDRSQGGLGIGLTLVRQLVELHGGRVEARSNGPGQGSEFIVRLPTAAALAVAGAETAPGESASPGSRGLKILLVEDNVDSAEMMSFLLELGGHVVRTVHDGSGALEAARAFKPQAVLCDIGLPGMNGYEVAMRLREQPAFKETPLIALTGYGQEEARDRAKAAGFDYHLVKPVEPDALNALLASIRTEGRLVDAAYG